MFINPALYSTCENIGAWIYFQNIKFKNILVSNKFDYVNMFFDLCFEVNIAETLYESTTCHSLVKAKSTPLCTHSICCTFMKPKYQTI